jgi:alpha-L-fucosidase
MKFAPFPLLVLFILFLSRSSAVIPDDLHPSVFVDQSREAVAPGAFRPDWQSLKQYRVPEWFRDAKFGIWAHWGPQCEPEMGDWYARHLYFENGPLWGPNVTGFHRERYGHPSVAGFKDVIHQWKAEQWNPERLMARFKAAGARYFLALANHHDNFDLWESRYQPWNSTRLGPQTDIVGRWASAARGEGLRFGVSVHAAHAWSWYEPSQGADKNGPFAGVPYDGKLTRDDGTGTWWEGMDPQELYEQRHAPAPDFDDPGRIHQRWDWGNGVTPPDQEYCDRFYNRTMDLINQHRPELIYFDDTALPLWPVSDAGLGIAAHFYNSNLEWQGDNGVLFGKVLTEEQMECMSWDIERGVTHRIEWQPWQTCTCIGNWHYQRSVYEQGHYKSAETVIHMLVDVVSKNGNLLLSIPIRGDGSLDKAAEAILDGIGSWMRINEEAIFETRPWKLFGEGPQIATAAPISGQGFNEGKSVPFTAKDLRFTTKGNVLYVFVMGAPEGEVRVEALGRKKGFSRPAIREVSLLGGVGQVAYSIQENAMILEVPEHLPNRIAVVFRIVLES